MNIYIINCHIIILFTNVPTAEKAGINKNHLNPMETMEKLGVRYIICI